MSSDSQKARIPHGVPGARDVLGNTIDDWQDLTNEERHYSIQNAIEELRNAQQEVPDDWR